MEIIFRPILTWPAKLSTARRPSQFKAGYNDTLRLLDDELRRLSARNVVIQLALGSGDIRLDGMPRADARPTHPGVILAFDSKHGPLSYPCDTFATWQDNLRAIALALEHLRAVDRYGVTKRGEQYRGWTAIKGPEMTREQAREVINGYGGETEALLATHPDRGGDKEQFHKVQEARKVLGTV